MATSEVPPPMSKTMYPLASSIGIPAPIAAAIGSSIKWTILAPAPEADSFIALLSTCVAPHGTHTSTLGLGLKNLLSCTFLIKCCNIFSHTIKSDITPSFIGLIA